MTIAVFYFLALLSLAIGTAAIYMALSDMFPVSFLYYHYFLRKPINWIILVILLSWTSIIIRDQGRFPLGTMVPILLSVIGLILSYTMHQEKAFKAVDFPEMASDVSQLPIRDEMEFAVIEYHGETKCYPLDYVIHHHIVNDTFNTRIVALTYCTMCRSIIPFDVTDIGPLFVASFKSANMIVADKKTKTFFQQATSKSIIGRLHPRELKMIPFQILAWSEISTVDPIPRVAKVSANDIREFQLPIPGIWKKLIATETTPGLSSKQKDTSFPSRTHVIGIIDNALNEKVVYLKNEVLENKVVHNKEHDFFLVGRSNTVNGFKATVKGHSVNILLDEHELVDLHSDTRWDIRGKYKAGIIKADLESIAVADEYWFSWKKFHGESRLIRLSST